MDKLLKAIESKSRLKHDSRILIESAFEVKKLKRGESLLQEGTTCKYIYFLSEGVARSYYFHNDKEVTSWFYMEGQWISSWYSFYSQQPGFEYIEVLEDAELLSISYSDYQKLNAENEEFNTFSRLLAEEQVAFVDYFSKGFSFMSAKEKYQMLHTLFPDISQKVNLGHIASFLGITQETLSRIRKKR